MSLFSAFAPKEQYRFPFYFIESTAPKEFGESQAVSSREPINIDGVELTPFKSPDDAVSEIADRLLQQSGDATEPALVVMVHGYNSPRQDALKMFAASATEVIRDVDGVGKLSGRLVCLGYRWPSESLGAPLFGSLDSLPTPGLWLLGGSIFAFVILEVLAAYFGLSNVGLCNNGTCQTPDFIQSVAMFGLAAVYWVALITLIVTLVGFGLRAIVYFRDVYRATNFGVPDLVEIIRQIDLKLWEKHQESARGATRTPRVSLIFVGHSMGGMVVTNAVRILSDVFDPSSIPRRGLNAAGGINDERPRSAIGRAFWLARLVLVSPDIPAEMLIGGRSNFLKSSLRRFEEAYLFSSEGDEVLRLISTMANYFSFPTRDRIHGYRLGNLDILSSDYGLISGVDVNNFTGKLRAGARTIAELEKLDRKQGDAGAPDSPALAFSYFDCTDCVETENESPGYLTYALRNKATNPKNSLGFWRHVELLWAYVSYALASLKWRPPFLAKVRINVHGGYFDGPPVRTLMYRLACLGVERAIAAYDGKEAFEQMLKEKQFKVMLSPFLASEKRAREPIGSKPEE
jgi:hypothetical protein